jgi:hypothetical protein
MRSAILLLLVSAPAFGRQLVRVSGRLEVLRVPEERNVSPFDAAPMWTATESRNPKLPAESETKEFAIVREN